MTVDDESSIYVGGLPYDATEESVRRVFDLYGAVVAVKIINERGTKGKCYGFVTFKNPRSAIDAINDMDGRTIGGRVVRVNEVNTRAGRSNFGKTSYRHNVDRGRDRFQERDYDFDRERHHDQRSERSKDRDRSHDRDRSRDCDRERERGYEHVYDHDQANDHLLDIDQDRQEDPDDNEQRHMRKRDLNWDLNHDRHREIDRTTCHEEIVDMNRNQHSRKWDGALLGHNSREFFSNSSDDYDHQVKERLERSTQRLVELQEEISHMEDNLEEKGKDVLDLQKKSKKLEDALIKAKKNSSYRQMQLRKLYNCYVQVKDYTERVKSYEQELQSFVDEALLEDDGDDDALWGVALTNGNA